MSQDLDASPNEASASSNPLAILNAATKIAEAAKDKWNSSGAADYVKAATDSLPEGTRDAIGNVQKNAFRRENLRSPTVYLGLGEERPFYLERSPDLLMDRMRHNLTYFYLNYGVLTVLLFFMSIITNPSTIIYMAILAGLWIYVVKMSSSGSIVLGGTVTVTQKQISMVMTIFTLFALFWVLSGIFWWTLTLSGLCVIGHTIMRDASMHRDDGDKVEMLGELDLEENATFLNPGAPKIESI